LLALDVGHYFGHHALHIELTESTLALRVLEGDVEDKVLQVGHAHHEVEELVDVYSPFLVLRQLEED